MNQGMVEKVGKAILEEGKNFGALAHHLKGNERLELRLARAAIKAMREPTSEMIASGYASLKTADDWTGIYTHMVDAALSTEGEK